MCIWNETDREAISFWILHGVPDLWMDFTQNVADIRIAILSEFAVKEGD